MNLQKNIRVEINKPLKSLTPIIKKWIDLIEKYSAKWKNEDALYWYNERATLSTFAGAIWLSGGDALEEFSSTKIKSTYKRSGKQSSGRTDLRFHWRGEDYIVEAKQISPSLHKSRIPITVQLQGALENACDDVKKFSPQDSRKKFVRIGITFLTPYLPKSRYSDIESRILELKTDLNRKHNYHLLAWLFLDSTRKLQYESFIYPGLVIAARVI